MLLAGERDAIVAAGRRLAAAGLVPGTTGNVSLRAGDLIAITPTGAVLADLRPEDVSIVGLDGELVDGPFEPTSEIALHLGAIGRLGAGAVVHTHAPMATAIACVLDELPCVHYAMLPLGGAVPVAPYRTFGTSELADVTLAALDGRAAVLMANHGALSVGTDLDAAVEHMEVLEWASALYWRASAIGSPRTLDDAQLGAVATAVIDRGYGRLRPVRGRLKG